KTNSHNILPPCNIASVTGAATRWTSLGSPTASHSTHESAISGVTHRLRAVVFRAFDFGRIFERHQRSRPSLQQACQKTSTGKRCAAAPASPTLAAGRLRRERAGRTAAVEQRSAGGAAGTMPATSGPPVLELTDISKSFPGVQALRGVRFDMRAGEVHALL